MGVLKEQIEKFLSRSYGDGDGDGFGYGSGSGDGYGDGDGDGFGYGSGSGDGSGDGDGFGYGSGSGSGDGSGYGYGSGYGSGSGDGSGDGFGDGFGSGYGSGSGYGFGYGSGFGSGDGIKRYNAYDVYLIDNTQTIITFIKGNIAKGFIVNSDLTLKPCYIAKEQDIFAHGETLHDAVRDLQQKIMEKAPIEQRIEKFKETFADFSAKYPASDLYEWHHILTGSCKLGRDMFCKDHGIDIEKDEFTVYEFVEKTKNSYGGENVKRILE